MNISLSPQLEHMVNRKIESGMYTSASEVIREALRLLNEHDEIKGIQIREMKEKVLAGIEQIREGKVSAFNIDEIIALGRELQKHSSKE
ncbi:MAG: type II toxin-antitoxin system ParD family antitoxin [Deltaproteobacteria bacterium]|nr:type II toxin-antitoxin system ParD family antitoxin [Deltaproteobacteria bacterium]